MRRTEDERVRVRMVRVPVSHSHIIGKIHVRVAVQRGKCDCVVPFNQVCARNLELIDRVLLIAELKTSGLKAVDRDADFMSLHGHALNRYFKRGRS